jgi:hypothetical protein
MMPQQARYEKSHQAGLLVRSSSERKLRSYVHACRSPHRPDLERGPFGCTGLCRVRSLRVKKGLE